MKIMFIVNPAAGKGAALRQKDKIAAVIEKIGGIEYQIKYTERPGHAADIAREGAAQGCDIIFAVGGDGTVNEVVNGLIGTEAVLGVIPGGSGNDFIRSLNIGEDVEDIIKGAIKGGKRQVDVGIINGRYFINISSIGFDAEVVLATQKAKKLFLSGSTAYIAGLISTIFRRKADIITMVIDGQEVTKEVLLVAVANGKYYGGGMMAAPDAVIDDGLFDICLITNLSKLRMLYLFPRFMKGKHKDLKEVHFYRSQKVHIESQNPMPVNIDGEVLRDKSATFEIVRNALFVSSYADKS